MVKDLLNRLEIVEQSLVALQEVSKTLCLNEKPELDDDIQNFLKNFLSEIYKNHTETIDLINQISPYVSVSDYYRKITDRAKIMKEFLDRYGWIFVAAGLTDENEIKQKKEAVSKFCDKVER